MSGPHYPTHSLQHSVNKYEVSTHQKYESKPYDGPAPSYEHAGMPKYETSIPKFEPKFEPKYEPNLSMENGQHGQINRNHLTSENARNILAADNNSISMTLMQ